MNRNKGKLAAFYYLAKKKPERYTIKVIKMTGVALLEYDYFGMWVKHFRMVDKVLYETKVKV